MIDPQLIGMFQLALGWSVGTLVSLSLGLAISVLVL